MRLSDLNNTLARRYRARCRQKKVLRNGVFVAEEYHPFGEPSQEEQEEQENFVRSIASQVSSLCTHNILSTPSMSCLSTQNTTVAVSDVDSQVTGRIAVNPNLVATTATAVRSYYDESDERIERLEQEMQELRALVRQLIERDIA